MPRENAPSLPPTWMMVLGSLLIVFHFFCALITTFAARSGPWPIPSGGSDEWLAPEFANTAGFNITEPYQRVLKNTHFFRFASNKQEDLEVSMEVVIRNASGIVTAKQTFPDPDAPAAVRYRQMLLARQLATDIPLPPQQAIVLPSAGGTLPTVRWWHQEADRRLVLKEADVNAVPRNQNFVTPSPLQYTVVKSFSRYLGRQHPGQKVEIIRVWHEPVMPIVLMGREPLPAEILHRFQSSYGELPQ